MTKVFCDNCGVEVDAYCRIWYGNSIDYGFCKQCDSLWVAWRKQQPDNSTCNLLDQWMGNAECSATNLLPLVEMVKRLLDDTDWSLTSKVHCCNSCENDTWYETDEVTRYHLIKLQHAYIDYMERENA